AQPPPPQGSIADLHDFPGLVAARGRDDRLVALVAPDQRAAERGLVADAPLLDVGLALADDPPGARLACRALDLHRRAEDDPIARRQLLHVDHLGGRDAPLELGDPTLAVGLSLLRVLVLGVLG